jgi:hypothetical protein
MKKTLIALVVMTSVVSADPVVLRQDTDRYALVGESSIITKDCTVTAEGTLSGRVVRERGKAWLVFLDRDGEEEAQCEIMTRVSRPRDMRREMVAKR